MGATAAVVTAGALFSKANTKRNKQTVADIGSSVAEQKDALNPPPLPPPPSALTANADAGKAMTQAAQRYRKQKGGGYGSTLLTGPAGDPSTAPTARKTLLGL